MYVCMYVCMCIYIYIYIYMCICVYTYIYTKVWETSNAMCLALLQRYRLDVSGPKLERKDPDEDDEDPRPRSVRLAAFCRRGY